LRVLFTTGVWGESYVQKFLEISLPSQLAEGNLSGTSWSEGSKYLITTSRAGAEMLRDAGPVRQLSTVLDVEIVVLDCIDQTKRRRNKYQLMNRCQIEALRRSAEFDALMFGYADTIWSAGTFVACARRIEQGFDAVMAPGLPVCEAEFVSALRGSSTLWKDRGTVASLDIPPRVLVRMILDRLHPMADANFFEHPVASTSPAYTMWKVPEQGVSLRAFHLHPVMIRVQPENARFFREFSTSLDEEYVSNLFLSKDNLYFARDSDELALCSLMQPFPHGFQVSPPTPPSARGLALWAERNASALHREFFGEEFRLHFSDVDRATWRRASYIGAELHHRIQQRLTLPDSLVAVEDPQAWDARRSRVQRLRHWQAPRYMTLCGLDSIATSTLLRIIVSRSGLAILKRINHLARRLGLNLRQHLDGVLDRLGMAGTLPGAQATTQPSQPTPSDRASVPEDPLSAARELCATYPVRALIRACLDRVLGRAS